MSARFKKILLVPCCLLECWVDSWITCYENRLPNTDWKKWGKSKKHTVNSRFYINDLFPTHMCVCISMFFCGINSHLYIYILWSVTCFLYPYDRKIKSLLQYMNCIFIIDAFGAVCRSDVCTVTDATNQCSLYPCICLYAYPIRTLYVPYTSRSCVLYTAWRQCPYYVVPVII